MTDLHKNLVQFASLLDRHGLYEAADKVDALVALAKFKWEKHPYDPQGIVTKVEGKTIELYYLPEGDESFGVSRQEAARLRTMRWQWIVKDEQGKYMGSNVTKTREEAERVALSKVRSTDESPR